MTRRPDFPDSRRLYDLFVRYWDGVLTDAEVGELNQRLRTDPVARDQFRLFSLQTVTVSDLAAITRTGTSTSARPAEVGRWSRRQWLKYAGAAGVVLGTAVGVTFAVKRGSGDSELLRLVSVRGSVKSLTSSGARIPLGGHLPPGATVSTSGYESAALLTQQSGIEVALSADTTVVVTGLGRLLLKQGTAIADGTRAAASSQLVLSTAVATLADIGKGVAILGHAPKGGTEVGVREGSVAVSTPAGESLGVVRDGQMMTVTARGRPTTGPIPETPYEFAWDLTRPLPDGWFEGTREVTPDGPVVRPAFRFDSYHRAMMYQVRSDTRWRWGHFRLRPDSVLRVRYRADRPGPGQLCLGVRSERLSGAETGMMEWNGDFAATPRGQWQTLEVKAEDMLDNKHRPPFMNHWIDYQVIFNTYETDLGLEIADFRVTRPGGSGGRE